MLRFFALLLLALLVLSLPTLSPRAPSLTLTPRNDTVFPSSGSSAPGTAYRSTSKCKCAHVVVGRAMSGGVEEPVFLAAVRANDTANVFGKLGTSSGKVEFSWKVNVAAGETFVLRAMDETGNQAFTSASTAVDGTPKTEGCKAKKRGINGGVFVAIIFFSSVAGVVLIFGTLACCMTYYDPCYKHCFPNKFAAKEERWERRCVQSHARFAAEQRAAVEYHRRAYGVANATTVIQLQQQVNALVRELGQERVAAAVGEGRVQPPPRYDTAAQPQAAAVPKAGEGGAQQVVEQG